MPKCIFCENELTHDTTPEHVLLNALGGRMKTKEAICSEHNNAFGGTIDSALAAQVEVIRNHLQLQSGTRKPPPALKKPDGWFGENQHRQRWRPWDERSSV